MTVTTVDLSHYQAGFDFSKFKAAGGLAVILKASEGSNTVDASYSGFRASALGAGLKVATYHYFTTSDPVTQANFYYQNAVPAPGERMVCDFEKSGTTIAQAIAFLQRLQVIDPTVQLTVYSGSLAKEQLGTTKNQWLADNTSLWLAQYTTGSPSWPSATWPQWSLWQYADSTIVAGFPSPVDTNRFNGPDDQLLKWIGPATSPAPPVDGPTVTITISADKPVTLIVNGVQVSC